jgi:DNA-directed RNA polymerase
MFLAAALEIHTCLIAKTKATSGLPIGVDATCSGLQHLSALTLNRDAAYQVNVVPTPEPSDGYRTVAEKAREYLPKEVGEWIDRKVTKRTVMTLPYGVQLKSARQYIYLALQEAGHTDEELKPFEGDIVDAIFNKAVPAVFPGPMSVMRWLKDSAAVVLKRGVKEICWRTPSGFVVQQIRDNKETDIISTKIMGSVRKMSVVKEGGDHKPSLKKHKQSISPNFIHSLDASLLHFMFSQWSKPFTAIHDCVLARSCDMDEMQSEIRLHFAEMYKGDPLNDWAKQLGLEVPDGMIIGDLDLDQVNHSHYFFC